MLRISQTRKYMIRMKIRVYQDQEISLFFPQKISQRQSFNLLERAIHKQSGQVINKSMFPVPVLILLVPILGLLLELNPIESPQEATENST